MNVDIGMTSSKVCLCVRDHNPNPMEPHDHHIIPKSWGGPDTPENKVKLCPTAHSNVHHLLDHYVRHFRAGLGEPPWAIQQHYSPYIRGLAAKAWAQRPDYPTYTLAA